VRAPLTSLDRNPSSSSTSDDAEGTEHETLPLSDAASKMRRSLAAGSSESDGSEGDEGEDGRRRDDVPGKGRGLLPTTVSPPWGGSTPGKPKSVHDALRGSISKVKTGLPYSAWSKGLLRKTCHLRGIGGVSKERQKGPLVKLLEDADKRKKWLAPGQVAYVLAISTGFLPNMQVCLRVARVCVFA